jgi:hypothetical protein
MNLALASIAGAVTVHLDGGEPAAVGRFEVPVTATLDVESGHATLNPAQPAEILAAAAAALHDVASRMLDDLPEASVVYSDVPLDATLAADGNVIRCAQCDETIAYPGKAILEHVDGGAHVFSPTLGS